MQKYPYSQFFAINEQFYYGVSFITVQGFFFLLGFYSLLKAIFMKPGYINEEWKQRIIELGSKYWSEYTLRADYPTPVILTQKTLFEKLKIVGFR